MIRAESSVEIRAYATTILEDGRLESKLAPPPSRVTDRAPGDGTAPRRPAREAAIAIETDSRRKKKVPPISGFADSNQRGRILHALSNHELQAIELFAWALLAFPTAPAAFRSGLLRILAEEQKHFRLYRERMEDLGVRFGDHPLSGYFWTRADSIRTPLEFVCAMCLTFENANLDHALALEEAARRAGDLESAAALRVVHDDEIGHVRFGLHWLKEWKLPSQSPAEAWRANIVFPLRPELARGDDFRADSRRAAGLDDEFIAILAAAQRPRALYRFSRPPHEHA
jgi:uncharacterized ferritin-like protein (DUF455 family)